MKIPAWFQTTVLSSADRFHRFRPRPVPPQDVLALTKIIAHRGVRDDKTVFENTVAAFDPLLDTNIAGFEFDIRWSKDLEPVVFHDADAHRLFGSNAVLAEHTLAEWQAMFPQVASLEQFVARYGKKKHLFIEIKDEHYPDPERQVQRLSEVLMPLQAVDDYHFMSFSIEKLELMKFVPAASYIPIANTNVAEISRQAIEKGYAGFGGHYLMTPTEIIGRHRRADQQVGLGFPSSSNSLRREINRGSRWIFTDHPVEMQTLLDCWKCE